MPVVYYDEDNDDETMDFDSPSAIFLVCFELAVMAGVYYMMFLA